MWTLVTATRRSWILTLTAHSIHFPENKSTALVNSCSILHHKPCLTDASATDVLDLIVLADKYECVDSIKLQLTAALREALRRIEAVYLTEDRGSRKRHIQTIPRLTMV